jgi:hypothetical protein
VLDGRQSIILGIPGGWIILQSAAALQLAHLPDHNKNCVLFLRVEAIKSAPRHPHTFALSTVAADFLT